MNYVFERVEKKYLLDQKKYDLLINKLAPYMKMDQYGLHTICNIYYDTDDYEIIRRSIDKPDYKEKFRIRSYGVVKNDDFVFLEIKKKYKGMVYKRRVAMTLKEMEEYLATGKRPSLNSQILNEIDYFIKYYKPKPKIFLAYDRIALYAKEDQNIRITFDQRIRSRDYNLKLNISDHGEMLLEDNKYLMEIKVPNAFPIWLVNILSELEIYPISFSKYGNVYKDKITNDEIESIAM